MHLPSATGRRSGTGHGAETTGSVTRVGELDLQVTDRLDPVTARQVEHLRARVEETVGVDPLGEHRRTQLRLALDPPGGGAGVAPEFSFVGVLAFGSDAGALLGYAQLSRSDTDESLAVELAIDRDPRTPDLRVADALLRAALVAAGRSDLPFDPSGPPASGRRTVRFWAHRASTDDDRLAESHGLILERELLQLRRPLPVDGDRTPFPVRPFVPGVDEVAWLEVNNRAFATHPEQGGWDLDTLREREREPWFDPAGFLLHEDDGRLAASCWTKAHRHHHPALGEIYVISVDPEFHGRGLGRSMTLAGLDWLAAAGLPVGMLYVDGANVAAVSLYRSMGFTEFQVDRAFTAVVEVGGHSAD